MKKTRSRYSSRIFLTLAVSVLGSLTSTVSSAPNEIPFDGLLKGLRYRLIGPYRGGRANTVSGVSGNPSIYYFGAAAGGVWKTGDGGVTWNPIFDRQTASAIGSIAVAHSDPNVIYVGTGDANLRANVVRGDGVYKSTDAGSSWGNVGLNDSHHIGRLVIDPADPERVFVAALGHIYGPNEERGVFRSQDGGRTWEKVLYVDENTGAADICLDPSNPQNLFASSWQVLRTPYSLSSGGPGSGLWRSKDGGTSWTRLSGNGLPSGILGRIGVAVSPARSSRVYAVIEADERGLYRSDDGGDTWKYVNRDHDLTNRAWYFSKIIPDPMNEDTVYVLNIPMLKSVDGGENFSTIPQHHVDNMGLWIDPADPRRMINGNDGGANVSVNGGKTWTRSDNNQPTGQIYRVATDDRFPFYIYGGQQDFGTFAIASRGRGPGIDNADWYDLGGCEMGWVAPDTRDPNIVYSGCTDGGIARYDHRTGTTQSIEPWPETNIGHGASDAKYRFQWTAPIVLSPHDAGVIYLGGNVLFRSTDEGMSWQVVSPDLTRNDKSTQQSSGGPLIRDNVGTETYGTIFALDESALKKGLIWAGSDDGLVHITHDGGETWTNVTPESLPARSRIHMIEASPHDPAKAYLAVDRHETDDFQPYIYKTLDFGQTWTLGANGIPNEFVLVVREDPVRRGLLYAGTEAGIHVSLNDGESWHSLKGNLPSVPVYDLAVKDNDLVVGTHGRAFWVLDDVTPLREMSGEVAEKSAHLFTPSITYRVREGFRTTTVPEGENPPPGASIYFLLQSVPEQELTLSILDAAGTLVRRFTGGKETDEPFSKSSTLTKEIGLNRFVWDLRYPGPELIPGQVLFWHPPPSPPVGPLALPGTYTIRLEIDDHQTLTAPLELRLDPRPSTSIVGLQAQFELHLEIMDTLSRLTAAALGVRDLREQLSSTRRHAEKTPSEIDQIVVAAAVELDTELDSIAQRLTESRMETPADAFHFPTRLDNKLSILMGVVADSDRAPTRQSYLVFEQLQAEFQNELDRLNHILSERISAFNGLAQQHGLPPIVPGDKITLPE